MGTNTTEPTTRNTSQVAAHPSGQLAKAVGISEAARGVEWIGSNAIHKKNTAAPVPTAVQDHFQPKPTYALRKNHRIAMTTTIRSGYSESKPLENAPVIMAVATSANRGVKWAAVRLPP